MTPEEDLQVVVKDVLEHAILPPISELLTRILAVVERLADRIEVLELEALHRHKSS